MLKMIDDIEILTDEVLRCKDRDFIVIHILGTTQGFYRSTGRHSGKPGTWFPCDGIMHVYDKPIWIVKDRFCNVKSAELMRYGTKFLKAVSDALNEIEIPKGKEVHPKEVNLIFKELGARYWSYE